MESVLRSPKFRRPAEGQDRRPARPRHPPSRLQDRVASLERNPWFGQLKPFYEGVLIIGPEINIFSPKTISNRSGDVDIVAGMRSTPGDRAIPRHLA